MSSNKRIFFSKNTRLLSSAAGPVTGALAAASLVAERRPGCGARCAPGRSSRKPRRWRCPRWAVGGTWRFTDRGLFLAQQVWVLPSEVLFLLLWWKI